MIRRSAPPRSARAYRAIWTPDGSPLRVHTDALADGARARRSAPGFARRARHALRRARARGRARAARARPARERIVVPRSIPQHAASSRGTALARASSAGRPRRADVPELAILPPFFAEPGFVDAVAAAARAAARRAAARARADELPRPARAPRCCRATRRGEHCLARARLLRRLPGATDACYRAQCLATSRAVAARARPRAGARLDALPVAPRARALDRPLTDDAARLARRPRRAPPRRALPVLRGGLPGDARGDRHPRAARSGASCGGEALRARRPA